MIMINPYHILNLTPKDGEPCFSLYANSERELLLLLSKAEEIGLKSYEPKILDRLFKPIHRFIRNSSSNQASYPLALFSSIGFSGFARLPFSARPLAVVAPSFHVKPLLKWMQREHPFSLLKLQEQEAILYQGSLSHFEEIERLPYSELRAMDGVFSALDRSVFRSIQSSRVPLVLAGDAELVETYKSISSYRAIIDEAILESSIFTDPTRLHEAAIGVLEPFLEFKEASLINSYWVAERSGRTSSTLQEIVQLALSRKIKHLFINEKIQVWGRIDHSNASFTYSPLQTETEDDVLDDLAELVLKGNGAVTVLPSLKMPNGKAACAILAGDAVSLRMKLSVYQIDSESWREKAVS